MKQLPDPVLKEWPCVGMPMGRLCVASGFAWLAGGQESAALECPGVCLAEEHPGGAARGPRGMDPWSVCSLGCGALWWSGQGSKRCRPSVS